MKAIIFGVTGQDGSHLSELLLEKGYEVIGVARRCSNSNSQRLATSIKHKKFELLTGDITDTFSVKDILSSNGDVDEVYNLAAQSHVFVSFKQPTLTWDITAKGCLNILQSIVDLNLKTKFYQASSSEMFGKNYDESYDEYNAPTIKYQDEDTPFMPQSPYAIAKLAAHHLVRNYRDSYGIFACSGILFNHESPRRGEQFVTRKITKWIGEFVNWTTTLHSFNLNTDDEDAIIAIDSGSIFPKLRLGNIEARRDWGHAADYARAIVLMMNHDTPDDYVISTGETHTIKEFLEEAFYCVGMDYDGIEEYNKYITIDPAFFRPSEVDYLLGDCSKAKKILGWKPTYSFKDLVQEMVEYDIHETKKTRSRVAI
jgi:GDPmannose 4,6-dehydratase